MKKLYYFAYGSNMLDSRMLARVGRCHKAGTYRLHNWKLVFDCGWKQAYANIIESNGDFVEGVLYELSQYQVAKLDKYEVYPYNYEHRYFILPDGNIGYAYVSVDEYFKCSSRVYPSMDYIKTLLVGSAQNGLEYTHNFIKNYIQNNKNKLKK